MSSKVDGFGLLQKLRESFTPDGILALGYSALEKNPHATADDVLACMIGPDANNPLLPEGTYKKACAIIATGSPEAVAVSVHPLDLIAARRVEPVSKVGPVQDDADELAAIERELAEMKAKEDAAKNK